MATATNGGHHIYARSLETETVVLVSADTTAAGVGLGPADSAAITPDGRWVAFVKRATNQVQGVQSRGEVYVRDLEAGTTAWASQDVIEAQVARLEKRPPKFRGA